MSATATPRRRGLSEWQRQKVFFTRIWKEHQQGKGILSYPIFKIKYKEELKLAWIVETTGSF